MCIRLIERYAVCKCTYHVHGVDPCQSVGQYGHNIQDRTVLVGYACTQHVAASGSNSHMVSGASTSPRIGILPDSLSSSSRGSYYR
ncbi:hypothetical protein BZA05DRAFT_184893 [Tricharina praecox]|uniref:uncharacterized protein n=1 Tax=Tricharina praecox TaxID=43433 RepID=UPI00221EA10C|nr:uncharacterized protein BZA05DRAFT_184893 [Tricharina praecox]KAI5843252.1 hypothetical protein BZA05DRAFT_184893 [Tricharina praecox]